MSGGGPAVAFGAPRIAGFIGARLSRRTIARLGLLRTLWIASLLRGPALLAFPFTPANDLGIWLCGTALGIRWALAITSPSSASPT